jgi:hypothetical protein
LRFAPDGRSVAYQMWRSDGRELFSQTDDGTLMSAEISTTPKIEAGIPQIMLVLNWTAELRQP